MHAAWPVAAVLAAGYLIWWVIRIMLMRPCWRCNTPPIPRKKQPKMLGFLPLVRCDRCGSWRGNFFTPPAR